MKIQIKIFEYILIYLSVLVLCVIVGAISRFKFIEKGGEEYTANIIFWVCTALSVIGFAIIVLFLDIFLIGIKQFFSKKKPSIISEKQNSPIENLEILDEHNKIIDEENQILEVNSQVLIDNETALEDGNQFIETDKQIVKAELSNDFSDIEKIRIRAKAREEELIQEKLELIVKYTKEKLALYTTDEDLYKLCDYVVVFLRDGKIENINPIKITILSTADLMHFGWNVWNHYKGNNQRIHVAEFLKTVFYQSFREIEETKTIEKLLTSRSKEGLIIIEKNLLQ